MPLQRGSADVESVSGTVLLRGKDSVHSQLLEQHLRRSSNACLDDKGTSIQAIIFDGTELSTTSELDLLYQQLHSLLPRLTSHARVLVLASLVTEASDSDAAAAAAALSGFTRSIAKELGRFGTTANLLSLEKGVRLELLPVVEFFLSNASAYVSGQVLAVKMADLEAVSTRQRPLLGKTALVTGAARGIGAAIAEKLMQQGARVIGLDIPQAEQALYALMQQLGGSSVLLDISEPESAEQLSSYISQHGLTLDIVVHNAGITRDKLFHRMTQLQWSQTLEINLRSVQRINSLLLERRQIQDQGRVILLSSMNGLAGQKGQTNYASSKAALAGYCQFMATQPQRGITFNSVAPGFIETQMTSTMPVLVREVGRRLNSLRQAGRPEDVASAVALFARPDASGLNGSVLRVCGQCLIGA